MLEEKKKLLNFITDVICMQVNADRNLDFSSINMIESYNLLLNDKLYDNVVFEKYIPYNFNKLLSNNLYLNKKDTNYINNINSNTQRLYEQIKFNRVNTPKCINIVNKNIKIDWNNFELNEFIHFVKESISHLSITNLSGNLLKGKFWDPSYIIVENKILNEGGALGCDKKNYSYALNTFNETRDMLYKLLESKGFMVEGIYSAGSLRRKKQIVGDLDFIINLDGHKKVGNIKNSHIYDQRMFIEKNSINFFNDIKQGMKETYDIDVINRKSLSQFKNNDMQCDIFLTTNKVLPNKRMYFTGSAGHNAKIMYNGYKSNLVIGFDFIYDKNISKFIIPKNERQIFEMCNLEYISPVERV